MTKKTLTSQELKVLIEKKKAEVAKEEAQKAASSGNNERLTVANSIWEKGISWGEREARFEKHKQLHPKLFPNSKANITLKEIIKETQDASLSNDIDAKRVANN